MPEFEKHGYQGYWLPARRLDGEHGLVVVIKRRYTINTVEATCEPTDETAPVSFVAEFFDDADPPDVSVRHPAEVAPEKRFIDVMVRGTAYAPGGKPARKWQVEVKIGGVLNRRLQIYGDRKCIWYPPAKQLTYKDLAKGEEWVWLDPDFTEPEPIDKVPLRYEFAYGGHGKIILTDDEQEMSGEAVAVEEIKEKRRERKKEIEEKLLNEEKAKEDAKKAPPDEATTDAEAKQLAAAAFADDDDAAQRDASGTQVLDADLVSRLNAEADADDGMKVVSALRLRPDKPGQSGADDDAKPDDDAGEGDDVAEAEAEADPLAEFFTEGKGKSATQALDIGALAAESDELRQLLDEDATKQARKLADEEGVLRDRATEFGDIKLHGDDWAADYMRQRPASKKKRKREESEFPEMPCPTNPTGKGFAVSHREEAIEGLPLPNIEDPDDPLDPEHFIVELNEEFDLKSLRSPAGWAPYPLAWFPRAQYWGVYPWDREDAEQVQKEATKDFDEEDPDDKPIIDGILGQEIPEMNVLAYQEAHPKMWARTLRGDEEVYLTNLTPDGNLFFRLPGLHPTATIDMSRGPEPLAVNLDTLLIDLEDPDTPAVELSWRGWYPLSSYEELGDKPFREVNIIEVDQTDWMDVKREEARDDAGAKKGGVTGFIDAITDEDLEKMEGDAEERYKAQFRKGTPGVGVRKDGVDDAVVFDQDEGRRLYGDAWDDKIRAEKDAFHEEAERLRGLDEEARLKEIRKKAREQADEEFGIIRDDEGEILVHDDEGGDA